MSVLFENFEILKESPEDIDYLGSSIEIDSVERRIKQAVEGGRPTIIAYLGLFGSGKSTILRNVKARLEGQYAWIDFDTWRYSNRSELWDAFVIKVAAELTPRKDEWDIADEIDGNELDVKRQILLWAYMLMMIIIATTASIVLWHVYAGTNGFEKSFLKYAVPALIPLLLIVGLARLLKISHLTDAQPMKRAFELEALLTRSVGKVKKPIVVVVEDVDRCGTADGDVFMETLHEYLSKSRAEWPMIVVAPQSKDTFNILTKNRTRFEHSLKVYDEKIYASSVMRHESVDEFYTKLQFAENYLKYRPAMIEITKELVYYYKNSQLTIRMLKHALREVEWFMQSHSDHNPAVALIYSVARMVIDPERGTPAVDRLRRAVRTAPHTDPEGNRRRVIDQSNVFGICLAMAVGAGGQAVELGLVDESGRYNQKTEIETIKIELESETEDLKKDEVSRAVGVIASVRPGY